MFVTRDSWDYAAFWVNLSLAVIGVAGVCFARKTLIVIHRQTATAEISAVAARDSADAALKQGEAMLREQRAWLLIEELFVTDIKPFTQLDQSPCSFSFRVKNYGKTPAFVTSVKLRLEFGDSDAAPPTADVFVSNPLSVNAHIIPQDDQRSDKVKLHPGGYPTVPQISDFVGGTIFLWAYGHVAYKDIDGSEHDTRICYLYVPNLAGLRIDGPKDYNRAT